MMVLHVTLRDVEQGDLQRFFDDQLDEEANQMAAFVPRQPRHHCGRCKSAGSPSWGGCGYAAAHKKDVAEHIVCLDA